MKTVKIIYDDAEEDCFEIEEATFLAAEAVFKTHGLTVADGIHLFLQYVCDHKKLPFDVPPSFNR